MIPKPIVKLLVQIAEKSGGARKRREANRDPERCLASLLITINNRVSHIPAMLQDTVEYSLFESKLDEAEQYLRKRNARRVNGKRAQKKAVAMSST